MFQCENCGHPILFHKESPPDDPCYLCPRGHCLLTDCRCEVYRGVRLSTQPHPSHDMAKARWGLWWSVHFMRYQDQTWVSSPAAVIEKTKR